MLEEFRRFLMPFGKFKNAVKGDDLIVVHKDYNLGSSRSEKLWDWDIDYKRIKQS